MPRRTASTTVLDDLKRDWWMMQAMGWLLMGLVLLFAFFHAATNQTTDPNVHLHVTSPEWTSATR